MLSDIVKTAVSSLAPTNPEGADLGAIEQWLRDQGHDVDNQQVRSGLRQLASNGAVTRVSRGRYLPSPGNEPDTQEPEAEAAE
jgi:predicted transcriptional regulator of viral defense system